MALLTTSGIPADATGASGDYAIDPVAHIIWGPKTSTWVGTASSLNGPSGPGMVYGQGAPTTNQGAIGQGYLDLASGNFYGPKASNGAWGNAVYKLQGAPGTAGTNGTNGTNGLSVLFGSGNPAGQAGSAAVAGLSGQVYIDNQTYIAYTYTNGAWTSGTSLVGPSGNAPVMVNMAGAYGPGVQFAGQSVAPSPGTTMYFNGTTIPNTFIPQANSALVGLHATNSGVSNATVYFYLTDVAAGTIVYNYNAGNGLANGTIAAASFSNTAYPLTAGKTYQWGAQRVSAGATTLQVNPIYLMPSGAPSSLSYYPPFYSSTSVTLAAGATSPTSIAGSAAQAYYRNATGSYLYYIDYYIAGSGKAGPFIYNSTASGNQFVLDNYGGYPTLTSTLTKYSVGPFSSSSWPFLANNTYVVNIYAPSASTVTQCYVQLTVGQ